MAAMVEEDSWDNGREKKRTRLKKSKEPKGGGMEWACPACAQGVRYPERLARHMVRCCPELCAASMDGPLGQARAVAGRIPKELRTRAAPEDPGEAERHGLCWRDLRARPNKAGPMTPDEERRAREALAFAAAREDEIRSAASFLAFHLSSDGADVDSESEFKVQQTPVTLSLPRRIERVREHLSLGTDRLTKMLKLYIRSEPLVADDAGDFDLVYEDDVWLCANKPPFVRTAPRHRFEGNSMVNRAIGYVRGKSGAQDGPPQENPRVLHRLDMDTSGVLLYSKDRDVAAHVQGLFRERKVSKKYLCICCGDPPPHFVVDTALERMEDHEVAMRVVPSGRETSQSKPSKTLFVTVARSPKGLSPVGARPSELHPYDLAKVGLDRGACASFCLICAIPLTGRTHQIRLHVASAGFPIVGDPLYGALSDELMPRQALHAFKLTLGGLPEGVSQPGTGFLAPLPRDMASCLGRLGMECKSVEEIDSIVRAAPFQEGEGKS